MPIVHIHKVTKTIENCINYGKADKTESIIQKDDISDTIRYAENDKHGEMVFPTLTNYVNTKTNDDFSKECKDLLQKYPRKRELRDGEEPALLFHLVQSFEGYVPPKLANQIGQEFASEFLKDYICQVSTHTNTDNIHNHIIFCAVNLNGERYNDCDDTMNQMRKVSDRISEKYGLRILEDTKDYKPIHWVDENGKHHSYEPTKRKNELIEKKKNGELVSGDISSYQNTKSYEYDNIKKDTLRETVKRDIDSVLSLALSYEHMLSLLREQYGYKISDKKKNGDYLAHVTFCPPSFSRGVRDYKIGDGEFYKRENLEKYISENNASNDYKGFKNQSQEYSEHEDNEEDVPIFDRYDYEQIDISKINLERRAWRSADEVKYTKRGEPEKTLIKDAQNIEKGLYERFNSYGFENWQADYIFHHLKENGLSDRFSINSEQLKVAVDRVDAIQERLNALHFVEDNKLYNYNNIGSVMKAYWDRYNSSFEKVNEVGAKLEKLRFLVYLPQTIDKIQKRIESNKNDSKYMTYEYANDIAMLQKYQNYLSTKGLDSDKDKLDKLIKDLHRWEETYSRLTQNLSEQKNKLLSYEKSVEILRMTVDGKRSEYNNTWQEYDNIVATEKKTERDNETVRKTQMKKKDDERNR